LKLKTVQEDKYAPPKLLTTLPSVKAGSPEKKILTHEIMQGKKKQLQI